MECKIKFYLENLLAACDELNIDACPIEGFESEKYDELLGLSARDLSAFFVCSIDYQSAEDMSQNSPKIRKPLNELFETI